MKSWISFILCMILICPSVSNGENETAFISEENMFYDIVFNFENSVYDDIADNKEISYYDCEDCEGLSKDSIAFIESNGGVVIEAIEDVRYDGTEYLSVCAIRNIRNNIIGIILQFPNSDSTGATDEQKNEYVKAFNEAVKNGAHTDEAKAAGLEAAKQAGWTGKKSNTEIKTITYNMDEIANNIKAQGFDSYTYEDKHDVIKADKVYIEKIGEAYSLMIYFY